MSSLIENLKGRISPKAASADMQAPAIAHKLEAAQSDLRTLEAQVGPLSFEAAQAGSEPSKALADLKVQILGVRDRVSMLNAAHKIAVQMDDDKIRAARIGIRRAQVNALKKHLDARDAAAEMLTKALVEVMVHWHVVVERSKKAGDIVPVGDKLPIGAISDLGQLKFLLARELYRLDPAPDAISGAAKSFPGALAEIDTQGQPDKIVTLVDALKANTQFCMDHVAGKVLG